MKTHEKLKIILRSVTLVRYKNRRYLNKYYYAKNWIVLSTSKQPEDVYNILINIYEREIEDVAKCLPKKSKILLLGNRPNSIF